MAVKRFSTSFISESGQDKSSNFIAGYSPAIDEMDLIERVSLTASAASITFSNIPQTYQHLQIRITGKSSRASSIDGIQIQFNSDTAMNYFEYWLYGYGSAVGAFSSSAGINNFISAARIGGASSNSSLFGSIITDIFDYKSTNKIKTIISKGGADANAAGSGFGQTNLISGGWNSTSSITSISLKPYQGNWLTYSIASLYGIRE